MHIHKEGYKTIILSSVTVLVADGFIWSFLRDQPRLSGVLSIGLLIVLFLILQFFRVPHREVTTGDGLIIAPADGKVVVIEKTLETEYLKDERIQVSIFMSPLNVHANYYPLSGSVSYSNYHPGKYLVAWHPKSSTDNERTTVAIKHQSGVEVVIRQIAGAMARRIVCYAKKEEQITQNQELGFIKFGSRVDLFLPKDAEILVGLNAKTKGQVTPIARIF